MKEKNKIYFASDFHLGADSSISSRDREMLLTQWLDEIADDALEIYFLGDIFDHWFEYKTVIPKGFVHFISKIAELRQKNIPITFFTGNHDMWMFDYFEKEFEIPVIKKAIRKELLGKNFYLLHGDGLPTDKRINRLMKKTFANPFLQWCYARLHPNLAIGIMKYFSQKSRLAHEVYDFEFVREKEVMIDYSENLIKTDKDLDFIVMGHRHLPVDFTLANGKTRHINLGDWIRNFSYGVYDGQEFELKFFGEDKKIFP